MYSTNTFRLPLNVHIVHNGEDIEINVTSINITLGANSSSYDRIIPWEEPKWINFCKKHKFNPIKDYNTKIYRLYLEMCAEDML